MNLNQKNQTIFDLYEKLRKKVGQAAHDINSPLAAMRMLLPEYAGSEKDRNFLNRAINRVHDIKNDLLKHSQSVECILPDNRRCPILIYSEILEAITEKKYEYSEFDVEFITNITDAARQAIINIDIEAFRRMLSNLINNAVEALNDKSGKVTIHLLILNKDQLQIIIEDSGRGMSELVRQKILNNIAVTSGKVNGHGIGFSQIHDTLLDNDGILTIDSKIDVGTKIILTFPRINKPE